MHAINYYITSFTIRSVWVWLISPNILRMFQVHTYLIMEVTATLTWILTLIITITGVISEQLTPLSFKQYGIILTSCDWDNGMCNTDSFSSSGIQEIKDAHQVKCPPIYNEDGAPRGYKACHPIYTQSQAWYRQYCVGNGK